jgi:hypothetical protein
MKHGKKRSVGGILLLYHHPLRRDAPTIMEHVNSFRECSRFKVWNVNTELGFPRALAGLEFQAIVLHYSLFGSTSYMLGEEFLRYLDECESSYKVAFFQDEIQLCQQRFRFLNRHKIDCVYTMVEPAYFKDFYGKFTSVPKVINYIPGYVSEGLISAARRLTVPDAERGVDVGYRARSLPFAFGRGAREKTDVADGFLARAAGLGLRLDIKTGDEARIYGGDWYKFVANCRAVLGVESGASFTDVYDVAHPECERLMAENPGITFEELYEKVLRKWEGHIPQRTISPRHFEAAALRVCQILFEGKYSGVMQPMVHYIPLRKDFSNFEEVIGMLRDEGLRREMTERAYRDLIASGRYSYRSFVRGFDEELLKEGLRLQVGPGEAARVGALLRAEESYRRARRGIAQAAYTPFPGRRVAVAFARSLVKFCRRVRNSGSPKPDSA